MKKHHRVLYVCAIFITGVLFTAGCGGPKMTESDIMPPVGDHYWASQKLWYDEPAEKWTEALPIGNGRLGAMVFGGVDSARIQLNEDSLWDGRPVERNNPDALEALPVVRKLLFEDKNEEATKIAGEKMMGIPKRIKSYQSLGDLLLTFDNDGEGAEYRRELDMDTGVATATYTIDGVTFTREVFASAPGQIIAVRITADRPAAVSMGVTMTREQEAAVTTGPGNTLYLTGQCGRDGMSFEGRAVVGAKGGAITDNGASFDVDGADEVTIYLAAATSYIDNKTYDADPSARCDEYLKGVDGKSFDTLKAEHIADHRRLFRRVALDIAGSDSSSMPTDERLNAVKNGGTDPYLAGLYFQYGRYLLMGSSRPGTFPANLQGIWNEHMKAPWNSDFHTNINLQMNYFHAETTNLAECHTPLFDLMDSLAEPGSKTARLHYDARGWVVHHLTDVWGFTTPADGVWGVWPMGAAWLARHPWEHYEYGGDRDFLEKQGYPLMKGAALFILDFLVEAPEGTPVAGKLVTNPSHSPENSFRKEDGTESQFTYAATMDIEIIRDLFDNCLDAIDALSETHGADFDTAFKDEILAAYEKLPEIKISPKSGRIQEWIKDYDEPEPGHRHMSHLYSLHPDDLFTPLANPEYAEAARKTLEFRLSHGGGHTGWSRAWIVNFYARLFDADKAYENLQGLLIKSTLPNLFDSHPPFQIDGNFGGTSGIAEMLIQSHGDMVTLLPALPDAWKNGTYRGLCAKGGFEIDVTWADGKLTGVIVRSKLGGTCALMRNAPASGNPDAPEELVFDTEPGGVYLIDDTFELR